MSGTDDKEKNQTPSEDKSELLGRMLHPEGGAADVDSDLQEHDEVDGLARKYRERGGGRGDNGDTISLDEQSDVDGEEVDDADFENVLLEALGTEESQPTGPGTPSAPGSSSNDQPVGDTKPAHGGSKGRKPADQAGDELKALGGGDEDEQECKACNAMSPTGMRFCVQCGTRLGDKGSSGPADSSAAPAADSDVDSSARFKRTSSDIRVPSPDETSQSSAVPEGMALVMIRDDGSDGEAISINTQTTVLGRNADKSFPNDDFLNPEHTRLTVQNGTLYIEDLHSLNGTFLKLKDDVRLKPGDTFLMGRQVLRFEKIEEDFDSRKTSPDGTRYMGSPAPGGDFKLVQVGVGDVVQNVYCLPESGVVLGREKGDIIFPRDKFMSGRHARIFTNGACHLVDLNSSNGTWIKLWEKTALNEGDYIFMGQQLFRVDLGE